MTWADLHQGKTETGKSIDMQTLYGFKDDQTRVDHNKRGKTGLPDADVLGEMVSKAWDLKLKKLTGDGMAFHVTHCVVAAKKPVLTSKLNVLKSEKGGAAVCFEDVTLPVALPADGDIVVHQSKAPCTRCRAAYKAWAKQRKCTIVVAADEGYDQSGPEPTFVFTPTGLVFFGK